MHSMENDFIKYEEEIYFFIQISQSFFHAYQEHLEYIDQENYLLTLLFGRFGDVIIDEFYKIDKSKIIKIFEFIEYQINSADKYFAIIIATGLVESIVINAENKDKSKKLFLEVLKLCHKNTYLYIKEWSDIHGCPVCPVPKQ